MASSATVNSTGLMPLARAASISSFFIARDALAMSAVPLMSAAMPVPDPPPVTEMRTSGCSCMYASAHASARLTRVSEPMLTMVWTGTAVSTGDGPEERHPAMMLIRSRAPMSANEPGFSFNIGTILYVFKKPSCPSCPSWFSLILADDGPIRQRLAALQHLGFLPLSPHLVQVNLRHRVPLDRLVHHRVHPSARPRMLLWPKKV
jgi:hypothetical protein